MKQASSTVALVPELQSLRVRMQAIETAAVGATTETTPASPASAAGAPIRYGLSKVQKFDAYPKQAHAASLMLGGVSKTHPVNATALDDMVEAFERKGLGMQHSRQFFEIFGTTCEKQVTDQAGDDHGLG